MDRRRFLKSLCALPFAPVAAKVAALLPAADPVVTCGGLSGIPYWGVNAQSGTYAGIDRAIYFEPVTDGAIGLGRGQIYERPR